MASLSLRDHFAYLPPPAEVLSILLGTTDLLISGLAGLTDPHAYLIGYGLKKSPSADSATSEESKSSPKEQGLARALASRNLASTALIFTFALYTRDRKSLGIAVGISGLVAVADVMVVSVYGVKELMGAHVISAAGRLVLGARLVYWGRS